MLSPIPVSSAAQYKNALDLMVNLKINQFVKLLLVKTPVRVQRRHNGCHNSAKINHTNLSFIIKIC